MTSPPGARGTRDTDLELALTLLREVVDYYYGKRTRVQFQETLRAAKELVERCAHV